MLNINNISKKIGGSQLFNELSFEIEKGDRAIFTGPSGCGKSTLVRMILGVEKFDKGEITIEGEPVKIAVSKGEVVWIPQDLGLWSNLSVKKNMSLVYKGKNKEKNNRIAEIANKIGIESILSRKVGVLSNGERQRVALARAFVNDSKLMIFDEPFSSLDIEKKAALFELMNNFLVEDKTLIFVTHDPYDSLNIKASRILAFGEKKLLDDCSYDSLVDRESQSSTLTLWKEIINLK